MKAHFLMACLMLPPPGGALGGSPPQESRQGEVAGTWCASCNRLIPAGQTCPHMGGGGPGESLRAQRIEEYNTFYVAPFNAGLGLQKAALATRDPGEASPKRPGGRWLPARRRSSAATAGAPSNSSSWPRRPIPPAPRSGAPTSRGRWRSRTNTASGRRTAARSCPNRDTGGSPPIPAISG